MTPAALLAKLRALGVGLRVDGAELVLTAPRRDTLTPALLDEVRAAKPDLFDLLAPEAERFAERAAIREYDGGYPRAEAERLAHEDVARLGTPPECPHSVTLAELTALFDLVPCPGDSHPIPAAQEAAVIRWLAARPAPDALPAEADSATLEPAPRAKIDVKASSSSVETPNPIEATTTLFGIRSGRGAAAGRHGTPVPRRAPTVGAGSLSLAQFSRRLRRVSRRVYPTFRPWHREAMNLRTWGAAGVADALDRCAAQLEAALAAHDGGDRG